MANSAAAQMLLSDWTRVLQPLRMQQSRPATGARPCRNCQERTVPTVLAATAMMTWMTWVPDKRSIPVLQRHCSAHAAMQSDAEETNLAHVAEVLERQGLRNAPAPLQRLPGHDRAALHVVHDQQHFVAARIIHHLLLNPSTFNGYAQYIRPGQAPYNLHIVVLQAGHRPWSTTHPVRVRMHGEEEGRRAVGRLYSWSLQLVPWRRRLSTSLSSLVLCECNAD